jgi:hypothetical protein
MTADVARLLQRIPCYMASLTFQLPALDIVHILPALDADELAQ